MTLFEEIDRASRKGDLIVYARLAMQAEPRVRAAYLSIGTACNCAWCHASELERKMALVLAKEEK